MKVLTTSAGYFAEVDVALPARGQATVDFGTGKTLATVSVSAPTITAQSVVLAQVAAAASADHSADEHVVEAIEVTASAPVAGVGFSLYARTANTRLFGRFNINWVWC